MRKLNTDRQKGIETAQRELAKRSDDEIRELVKNVPTTS